MERSISPTRRDWLAGSAAVFVAGTTSRAAGATPAAADRIRLNLNENPFEPSLRVIEAIRAHMLGLEHYVKADEVARLTAQIAELERPRPEQVVIGEALEPLGLYLARQRPGGGSFVYSDSGYAALVDARARSARKACPCRWIAGLPTICLPLHAQPTRRRWRSPRQRMPS